MQRPFDDRAVEATALALVASGLLIGASLVGVGGGIGLVAALAVLAALLAAGKNVLPRPGRVVGHDFDLYCRDLWAGPALAAVATAVVFGATPVEIQTVGGVIGFVGMVNYFLRPVYHMAYSVVERVVGAVV
jgi:hypothetical protein